MKFILGEKLNMDQTWDEKGMVVPFTVIKAGPCQVTQVRTKEKDGYQAIQVGFGLKKKMVKPAKGHLKALPLFRFLREVRLEDETTMKRGDTIDISQFVPGDIVQVTGVSKGKGFQGVVKRHGFHGHPATHGHKDQLRMPGSIGAGGVQHVRKGKRMAGRMGGDQITVKNLKVVSVDKEGGFITVSGAVPGAWHTLIMIQGM